MNAAHKIMLAIILLASVTQAVTVVNRTTGRRLFFDDFENASGVSHVDFPDESGDYDPGPAKIGTWTVSESAENCVQVVDYKGGGSCPATTPQGSNYLRVVRNRGSASLTATLSTSQKSFGEIIHFESMVWVPGDVTATALQVLFLDSTGKTCINLSAWDNRRICAVNSAGSSVFGGLEWIANIWQKWEIDLVLGESSFDLTVDGVTKTYPVAGVVDDVAAIQIRGGVAGDRVRFYLDSTGYDGKHQKTITLFQDGFENGTVGLSPLKPDVGMYKKTADVQIRTGDLSADGGPMSAHGGTNYLELSRLSGTPALGCAFAGGVIDPNAQNLELHARFYLWLKAGIPGHGISGSETTLYGKNYLTYNIVGLSSTAGYSAHNGVSYVTVAPAGSIAKDKWVPLELVWNSQRQEAKVSINGGPLIDNILCGDVPDELCQLFFGTANGSTVYWIDDLEVYWLYTPPPPPGFMILVK